MKKLFSGLFVMFSCLTAISAQTAEAFKFDEFEHTTCDDYWSRTSFLYTELDKTPGAKAYIFVYQGKIAKHIYDKRRNFKRTDYVTPPRDEDSELIGYLKRDAAFKRISTDRVAFLKGGFREKFTVEFWIVPNGANPPKSSPTLEKIKQRKPVHHPYKYCGEM